MYPNWKHHAGRLLDVLILPLMPPARRLALQYGKYVSFFGWEPEVRRIRDYAQPSELAIDIGANMGLWTYAMARSGLFGKILAFEPNPSLTDDLRNARLDNVTVLHKAVSNASGARLLRIPRQGNSALTGWASLERRIDIETDRFEEIPVDTVRLDDLGLDGVGFIKIDVEGHELSLLQGGRELFARNRPVCVIECRERNRDQVEAFFAALNVGYRRIDTTARFGFELSPGNLLFTADALDRLPSDSLGRAS